MQMGSSFEIQGYPLGHTGTLETAQQIQYTMSAEYPMQDVSSSQTSM